MNSVQRLFTVFLGSWWGRGVGACKGNDSDEQLRQVGNEDSHEVTRRIS